MNTSRFFYLRASLVIAALISLCVSSNVGPRFLPLPEVSAGVAETPQDTQHNTASRLPWSLESDNFRVPMMAQTHKRASTEQQPQPIAISTKGGVVVQNDAPPINELSYAFVVLASAPVLQPPGRAPPRLV